MTKPTPAQIEAEVARQGRIANWGHPAAAAVGELPSVNWKDGKPYSYCPECGRDSRIEERAMWEQRGHTIERCAQVAFDAIEDEELAFAVVAAIRSLKAK